MAFRPSFAGFLSDFRKATFYLLSRMLIGTLILFAASVVQGQDEEVIVAEKFIPRVFAYAENDFVHKRPLAGSLELGFRYIEADTFLVDNRLMIGSSVLDMQSKGSLESLYFEPIAKLVQDRSDWIPRDGSPLTLVIDVKSEAESSYRALRVLLNRYKSILTQVVDGELQPNAVTVIVTGNCAREQIAVENPRFVAIDGRLSDLESNSPTHLIPIISARWGSHFRWQGKTSITPSERNRLQSMVERAHSKNRLIRFWSTPDVDLVWTTLQVAGVDLIGAENFEGLVEFVTPRKSPFATPK
jgi:hypothetical protein